MEQFSLGGEYGAMISKEAPMSFEAFWKLYPRKVAKQHAARMWKNLARYQQEKAMQAIGAHIKEWTKEARTIDKIPHAGSWLNGWRFDDELKTEIEKKRDVILTSKGPMVWENGNWVLA